MLEPNKCGFKMKQTICRVDMKMKIKTNQTNKILAAENTNGNNNQR